MGSNIEPRADHIRDGLDRLRASGRVVLVSRMLETEAVVLPGRPAGAPYLNGACIVETGLSPRDLLRLCLDVERSLGRDRQTEGRWGARTLDLDLLLFGDRIVREPGLEIPHPRMLQRLFVLEPLAEIAGDWIVPHTNKNVRQHLDTLRTE